jgi:hypothetical protein
MNLYKVNFTTIIHCEDDLEAAKIARELAVEVTPFTYEEESVKEVLCEDDLPYGWEMSFHPVMNEEGSFDTRKIREILHENAGTLALRKRIEELEKELQELRAQQ